MNTTTIPLPASRLLRLFEGVCASAITIASYAVAFALGWTVLTVLPLIAYAALVLIGLLFYGDPGGLLNLVVVPLLCLLLGLVATTACMVVAVAFHILARVKPSFTLLAPLFAILAGVCFVAGWSGGTREGVLVTSALALYFLPGFLTVWTLIGGTILGQRLVRDALARSV
ncbi:hypothetical protein HZA57_03875 [Candidatus Poribacteria bacterium]|nr:hypothetical protein [Candidatus Poribacteria bacterium]